MGGRGNTGRGPQASSEPKHIGEHDKSKRDWNWRSLKTTWWEEIKIPGEQNPEKKQENSEKTKSGLVLLPTFD